MKLLCLILGCGFFMSCTAEPPESLRAIQLARAIEPDSDCEFALTNESWSQGWYDPKAATVMSVHLEVGATGLEQGDSVNLDSIRVCYTDASRTTISSGDHTECDDYFSTGTEYPGLFGQTVTVSGLLESCSGEGCTPAELIEAQFLDESMLQKIYGEDYSSSAVSVWFSDAPMGDGACCRYFYTDLFLLGQEDRMCCTDAVWEMGVATGPESGSPWGEFNPRPKTDLKIEFQLIGQASDGQILTSAWLTLPTSLCPGCTSAHGETTECAPMTGEFCDPGVCEVDGVTEACTANGCSQTEIPCTNFRYALSGETPDVQGCIVSQMQGIRQRCKQVVACQ
jgi:hypothetical protein